MEINLGMDIEKRQEICEILTVALANTYAIFLKTQNYHWNIEGKEFYSLHILFEKQYEELFEAIDILAERIRALGGKSHGSFSKFQEYSQIKEETEFPSISEMLKNLLLDHETHIRFLRHKLPIVEKAEDGATADLINKRLDTHEKAAWMLRSSLP